ncbi:hypothetical protein [Streptomyces sp. WG5]|uniref:hypothetical protein n=1 Tax=Streptomyces sp. WG5 TaxID=3417648 RepID=UPI003CF431ED
MWKWTVSGVLVALAFQGASIAVLLGGIRQHVTAGSPDCAPVTRICAADGTRQRAASGEAWELILLGGALSLVLPVSAVVGVLGGRLDPPPGVRSRRVQAVRQADAGSP